MAGHSDPFAVGQVTDMGGNENPFDHALGFAHGEVSWLACLTYSITLVLAGAASNVPSQFLGGLGVVVCRREGDMAFFGYPSAIDGCRPAMGARHDPITCLPGWI